LGAVGHIPRVCRHPTQEERVYTVASQDSVVTSVADDSTDGRRVFLVVAVTVVALAGILGFFVGANGADVAPSIPLVGGLVLPTTPATMTVYGMLLAAVSLGVLFGLVTLASRFDEGDGADLDVDDPE
jgi:hypothetical protein